MLSSPAKSPDRHMNFGPEFLRLLDDVDAATTIEQISSCCTQFVHEAGAEHFVYRTFMPAFAESICVNNVNPEWERIYREKRYSNIDPRSNYCIFNHEAIRWRDLTYSDDENGRMEKAVMEHARQYGYVDGISFPVHGVGLEASFFNLSSPAVLREFSEIEIQAISVYANKVHRAIKRILRKNNPKLTEPPVLSKREKECLKWTANGKTSWEVGQILGLSESTVVFHISKAVNKLGVNNRVHAVAKALAQSQIHVY